LGRPGRARPWIARPLVERAAALGGRGKERGDAAIRGGPSEQDGRIEQRHDGERVAGELNGRTVGGDEGLLESLLVARRQDDERHEGADQDQELRERQKQVERGRQIEGVGEKDRRDADSPKISRKKSARMASDRPFWLRRREPTLGARPIIASCWRYSEALRNVSLRKRTRRPLAPAISESAEP
jgi:hypothetical protein